MEVFSTIKQQKIGLGERLVGTGTRRIQVISTLGGFQAPLYAYIHELIVKKSSQNKSSLKFCLYFYMSSSTPLPPDLLLSLSILIWTLINYSSRHKGGGGYMKLIHSSYIFVRETVTWNFHSRFGNKMAT